MKYGTTSRGLCVFFHGFLALCAAMLAVYFGFFVLPTRFSNPTMFITTTVPVNLILEMAVYGTTAAIICVIGLVHGIKAVMNPNDDEPVLKSFRSFIVLGYVSALFFLLNGVVFFNLLTATDTSSSESTNPAFVIAVGIIIAIGLLIAANVPMVRLFDTKGSVGMFKNLAYGFAINCYAVTFYSLIFLLVAGINDMSITGMNTNVYTFIMIWIYIAFSAVAGTLLLLCGLFTGKKASLSSLLGCLGVFVIGAAFVTIGGLEIGVDAGNFHFTSWIPQMNITSGVTNSYGIACIVFGCAAVLTAIVSLLAIYKPWTTPATTEAE